MWKLYVHYMKLNWIIFGFSFSLQTPCIVRCEVRSIVFPAACLEIRPGWSLLNSVAAAQTQQSVIQEQNVTWVKKLQMFLFSLFFCFFVAPERCERIYQQQLPTEKSLCWYHEIPYVPWNNHRHSRSITRFTARKTEELNQATTKNRASRSFKFGMPL